MTKLQIIPGNFDINDPNWPAFDFIGIDGIYTSDTLSEDGYFVDAHSDAALGGMSRKWLTEGDGGWEKQGGIARSISETGIAGFQPPSSDCKTSITLEGYPNPGRSLTLSNRRSTFAFSSSSTEYVECRILSNGSITLAQRVSQEITTIASAPAETVNIGDTVALATFGTMAEVLVNGTVVASATTDVVADGYTIVRATNAGGGTAAFSNFLLSTKR